MSIVKMWLFRCVCLSLMAAGAAGCGSSETPREASGAAATEQDSGGLPRLAIAAPEKRASKPAAKSSADADPDDDDADDPDSDADDDKVEFVAPKSGTAEWFVHEGTKLLVESPPKSEDVEVLKKHRKERNEQIIKLSQKAIELTHSDKEKERVFNLAVHNLMEARLQQALTGQREDIDLLYEDAGALYKRDPKSQAAAEGAHTLVNLAYTMAKDSVADTPRWLTEFARQARHFAEHFARDERRSLPLLFTAGRSCELAGMTKEALTCYTLIQKNFPKSQFAGRVGPIVRRLKLPGNAPQLAGPTIDGDPVAVDDLLGKVVLVVFWSTEIKSFLDQLPQILAVTKKESRRGLRVIGVNLNLESAPVEQFLLKQKIAWPQIFYAEAEKRGWSNPIVEFYGIMDVPVMWLIDQNGNVVSTDVKVESLAAEVAKLLDVGANSSADDTATHSKTTGGNPPETIIERAAQGPKKRPAVEK